MNKLVEIVMVKRGLTFSESFYLLQDCEATRVLSLVVSRDNTNDILDLVNIIIKNLAIIIVEKTDKYRGLEFLITEPDAGRNFIVTTIFALLNIMQDGSFVKNLENLITDFVDRVITKSKPLFSPDNNETKSIVQEIMNEFLSYKNNKYLIKLYDGLTKTIKANGINLDKFLENKRRVVYVSNVYNEVMMEILIFIN